MAVRNTKVLRIGNRANGRQRDLGEVLFPVGCAVMRACILVYSTGPGGIRPVHPLSFSLLFTLLFFSSFPSCSFRLSYILSISPLYTMGWNSRQDPPSSDPPSDPVPRRSLPAQLQKLVDHDDGFYDDVYSS